MAESTPLRVIHTKEAPEWKELAPRWFLLLIIAGAIGIIGWQAGQLNSTMDREQQRLEAAVLDAPTKYQARLSERVAVNEEQFRVLTKSVDNLAAKVETLTGKLDGLTSELKKERK